MPVERRRGGILPAISRRLDFGRCCTTRGGATGAGICRNSVFGEICGAPGQLYTRSRVGGPRPGTRLCGSPTPLHRRLAERLSQEATELREMLDALPVPVWRRAAGLALEDCNRAYARALDTTRELAIAEGRELAAAVKPGERRHVVIGGSRRLHRDHRGAVRRRRENRFCARSHRSRDRRSGAVASHQRACRGARRDPRLRRNLWPRQAAQILQFRFRLDVGHRRGLARRAALLRGGCGAAARAPPPPGRRRFPGLQMRAAADVHLADQAAAGVDASAGRPHLAVVDIAASVRRAHLRLRGRHRPPGARALVQHLDPGAARDPRPSVRGHRRLRQRRAAEAVQPGLSGDLGIVGRRCRRRAAYRRDRREDPRPARRWRRLDAEQSRGSSPGSPPMSRRAARSTGRTARCCRRRPCRCPTAMCC